MPYPILVIGVTGGVGQHVVHKLLEREVPVHLMVRDVARAEKLFGPKPVLIPGDVSKPETVQSAFDGAWAVICAPGNRDPDGENYPEQMDFEGMGSLVAAAVGAKATARGLVDQFVLVSSIAVTRPDHPLNQPRGVWEWMLKGEEALRTSGLTYTIVRPGELTGEPGGRHGLIFDQGDRLNGQISRSDVAEVCIQALEQPQSMNVTFEVIEAPGAPPQDWSALFDGLRPDPRL